MPSDKEKIEHLRRLLHSCNTVAIEMGHAWGLSDEIDNHGTQYMSQELADVLAEEPLPKPIQFQRGAPNAK